MARINLLPWREELRRERQRRFYVTLGGATVAAALAVVWVHLYINGLIEAQRTRNRFLEQEIARVDRQIKEIRELEKTRKQLLARMRIIQELQQSRPLAVRLFDEIARAVPEGVQLLRLAQQGDTLTIEGLAESNARVSALMRNLEASPILADPRLEVIQATRGEESRVRRFTLRVTQVGAKGAAAEEEQAG
ncbi:PilN domain-containing protein [Inmirania thermothiophila]|uniref:Type IV pilus assembly protein PilN n=1 Tax=Inmirania thermothiophila TaxID=1750597 RepID=A0A3N1Y5N8_9GAMM|nr:PilN domain-containing protein [Inmirania thermothiophila]ROR34124.1 type IV pilus assembly protein PilN [Inmirania thermothiophila]